MKLLKTLLYCSPILFLISCLDVPENVKPIENFKLEKYLGKWHEIARLNHWFEEGLTKVSATYSMREDGGVKVLNRGYHLEDKEWQEAEGKAYFADEDNQGLGFLKVSFFGPFYSSYIIFDLDSNYQTSLVSGPDKSYLWLLARDSILTDSLKMHLISKAEKIGFDLSELIWVDQTDSLLMGETIKVTQLAP